MRVRAATATHGEDIGAAVHLWLDGYRNSPFGLRSCPRSAGESERVARALFFDAEKLRPLWHLRRGDVSFLVDDQDPDVIYGMAATTGDYVHYAMVKRYLTDEEKAEGFVLLLGDRLTRAVPYTSDLFDLRRTLRRLPTGWYLDGGWYFRELNKERDSGKHDDDSEQRRSERQVCFGEEG